MLTRNLTLIALLLSVCIVLQADKGQKRTGAEQQIGQSNQDTTIIPADINRSPLAVAVSPDRRYCLSANLTSHSVSLVDLKLGKIVTEHRCGRGPVDAVWVDQATVLVSLRDDDAVALLRIDGNSLKTESVIPVGDEPGSLTLVANSSPSSGRAKEGLDRAFVAISGFDQVAVLDLKNRKVAKRIPVGGQPRTLAVSPNGVASCTPPSVIPA